MSLPKVTALVPSYNHGEYIHQRIMSILNQTYKNFELIVIDDCSNDSSHEVISALQTLNGFQYLRNEINTGSPFSAWERICSLATGDYIWVCESDDFAEPEFLENAVGALIANRGAVLYYCNSWVVSSIGERVDQTSSYFRNYWPNRWESDFVADGLQELSTYQLRAQTVPNMSSVLIQKRAFCAAYTPFLKKLKLAGDWLFIGRVMKYGDVVFSTKTLNNFRRHEQTARVRVKQDSEWAEYMLTIYLLYRVANCPLKKLAHLMAYPARDFINRDVTLHQLIKALFAITWVTSTRCLFALGASIIANLFNYKTFRNQYAGLKPKL